MLVLWRVPHVSRLESFWCPIKVGWFAFRVSILPRRTKSKFKTIMVKKISKRFTHIFTHTHTVKEFEMALKIVLFTSLARSQARSEFEPY